MPGATRTRTINNNKKNNTTRRRNNKKRNKMKKKKKKNTKKKKIDTYFSQREPRQEADLLDDGQTIKKYINISLRTLRAVSQFR